LAASAAMGLAAGVMRTQAPVALFFNQRRKAPLAAARLRLKVIVVASPELEAATGGG